MGRASIAMLLVYGHIPCKIRPLTRSKTQITDNYGKPLYFLQENQQTKWPVSIVMQQITRGFGVLPIRTSILDTMCASMWQVPQLLSGVGGVTLSKDGTDDWIGRIVVLGISWGYLGIPWVYCWAPWVCYWKWPSVASFPSYKIWVFQSCLYVYQRYYIWDQWWTEAAIKGANLGYPYSPKMFPISWGAVRSYYEFSNHLIVMNILLNRIWHLLLGSMFMTSQSSK